MNDSDVTARSITAQFPDVPMHFLPSAHQYKLWRDWVDWEQGADPNGEWLGSCPLHDAAKESSSAVFNFDRGVLRCQGDPCCHAPKHAMSLGNVSGRMSG